MIHSDDCPFRLLGEKIKTARVEQGMTQERLSVGIVTRNMLSAIENGKSTPSLETLCALAERLNVSVGYLLSDRDDGSEERVQHLLELIAEDFKAENYASALAYAVCLPEENDTRVYVEGYCHYMLGVEQIYVGTFPLAKEHLSAALRCKVLPAEEKKEARLYFDIVTATLAGGNEIDCRELLFSIAEYARIPHDIVTLSSFLRFFKRAGAREAKELLPFLTFEKRSYGLVAEGTLALAKKDYALAKKKLIEALGFDLMPLVRGYCLGLLEKCCAALEDYENAYAYVMLAREQADKILAIKSSKKS